MTATDSAHSGSWQSATVWRPPACGDVDVWLAALDSPGEDVERLRTLLSSEERERAAAFRVERHYRHFVVAHSALRRVVARYVGADPALLRFGTMSTGKPVLQGTHGRLHFSLSHSGNLSLIALSREHEVGVDVEMERTLAELEPMAERILSRADYTRWRSLPNDAAETEFFRLWTKREALIKAGARLNASDTPAYTIRHLDVASRYVACLAVEGMPRRVRCWTHAMRAPA